MKLNLNIIKFILLVTFLTENIFAVPTWTDECIIGGCSGCKSIETQIKMSANNIDKRHVTLEKKIAKKYKKDILEANIYKINKLQKGLTKSIARINAMEYQANIDSKKLIFLLKKNKELYTVPIGLK